MVSGRPPTVMRRRLMSDMAMSHLTGHSKIGIIVALVVVLALAVWLIPKVRPWMAIDRCLDAGGRWDY
jgi:hypothetical protein